MCGAKLFEVFNRRLLVRRLLLHQPRLHARVLQEEFCNIKALVEDRQVQRPPAAHVVGTLLGPRLEQDLGDLVPISDDGSVEWRVVPLRGSSRWATTLEE